MKRITIPLIIFAACLWAAACRPQKFEADVPPVPIASPEEVATRSPLTIVIELSEKGGITLHAEGKEPEDVGTFEDTSRLTDRLKTIFEKREREGQVERTVFIKSPKAIKYGKVVAVIDAAKIAKAQPIGLQVDDLKE